MEAARPLIDWQDPEVLLQIVDRIKSPLNVILEATRQQMDEEDREYRVIFSSSKEIREIIEQIAEDTVSKSVQFTVRDQPEFFLIYDKNLNVQKMCSEPLYPEKITEPDKNWLLKLEKEIQKSIEQKDVNLPYLSYQMAVSERQLYRRITQLVHLTPNKYIQILRLDKAKWMIENFVQHSISQIAYAVGYNDPYYFSTLFAKQYNMTPKAFIESLA